MRNINIYCHVPYLYSRFMGLLSPGSFAFRSWRQIGANIDEMFAEDDDVGGSRLSSLYPGMSLFYWLYSGRRLDFEWLRDSDGNFYDDKGKIIPMATEVPLTPVEHLAAYGLWLIEEDAHICGPSDEGDWDANRTNPHGWTESQVLNHRGECLLIAYQTFSCAQRFLSELSLTTEETQTVATFDFAALGKQGAHKRHAPMKALEKWAVELYRAGQWPSANRAAYDLKDKVIEYGRTINAPLIASNAQNTIANWFRKAV